MSQVQGRMCGACTACCTVISVEELNKAHNEPCVHCNEGSGCAIYNRRPQGCRTFMCEWLHGYGDPADRPDQSSIILDKLVHPVLGLTLQLWEAREGALSSPYARSAAQKSLRDGMFVLYGYLSGKTTIIIPPGKSLPPGTELDGGMKAYPSFGIL